MPAPGGSHKGSESSSRGYAGGSQQRSANAATGSGGYGGSSNRTGARGPTGAGGAASHTGASGPAGAASRGGGSGGYQGGGNFGRGDTPSSGRSGYSGSQRTGSGMGFSGASMAQRAQAVSRGPGTIGSRGALGSPGALGQVGPTRNEAIARSVAFGESPAGMRAPGLARQLTSSALKSQGQVGLTAKGLTPQQQGMLDQVGSSILGASIKSGLDPRTITGQLLTESSSSKNKSKLSGLATDYNNLFGVKATGQPTDFWSGEKSPPLRTTEYVNGRKVSVKEPFRSFETPNLSVLDYGRMMTNPRYAPAAKQPTVAGQIAAIREGKYATHPSQAYNQMVADRAAGVGVSGQPGGGMPTTQIASRPASVNIEPAGYTTQTPRSKPDLRGMTIGIPRAKPTIQAMRATAQALTPGRSAYPGVYTMPMQTLAGGGPLAELGVIGGGRPLFR